MKDFVQKEDPFKKTDENTINIMFLDSASSKGMNSEKITEHYSAAYSKVVEYLKCEAKTKYNFNKNQISNLGKQCRQVVCDVPEQGDGDSCGIFFIQYIQCILTDQDYFKTIRENGSEWFDWKFVNGEIGREKLRIVFEKLKEIAEEKGYFKEEQQNNKDGAVDLVDDIVILD